MKEGCGNWIDVVVVKESWLWIAVDKIALILP